MVKPSFNEQTFLEGPQSRVKEFLFTLKVILDFIRGFRVFHFIGPCVTVFGSARFKEDHPYYTASRKVAGELAKLGFTIMTGGGPGLMEAANRGAKEAGGKSVGCNIILPMEQKQNNYLDHWVSIHYFFVRKVLLTKYSYAFVVMPGGYGTLDEFFEATTLIQTSKIKKLPVIVFGKEYHANLYNHLQTMVKEGTIDADDIEICLFTDSIEEAIDHIKKNTFTRYNTVKKMKPIKWLGEKNIQST